MKARVTVTLKTGVLDPQGKAIVGALDSLDFKGVESVRQGKVFDLVLNDLPLDEAKKQLTAMCEQLLANTVIENYRIKLL